MKKINFIGGFLIGALGSIWTLFIFVLGIVIGVVLNLDYAEKSRPVDLNKYRPPQSWKYEAENRRI